MLSISPYKWFCTAFLLFIESFCLFMWMKKVGSKVAGAAVVVVIWLTSWRRCRCRMYVYILNVDLYSGCLCNSKYIGVCVFAVCYVCFVYICMTHWILFALENIVQMTLRKVYEVKMRGQINGKTRIFYYVWTTHRSTKLNECNDWVSKNVIHLVAVVNVIIVNFYFTFPSFCYHWNILKKKVAT